MSAPAMWQRTGTRRARVRLTGIPTRPRSALDRSTMQRQPRLRSYTWAVVWQHSGVGLGDRPVTYGTHSVRLWMASLQSASASRTPDGAGAEATIAIPTIACSNQQAQASRGSAAISFLVVPVTLAISATFLLGSLAPLSPSF